MCNRLVTVSMCNGLVGCNRPHAPVLTLCFWPLQSAQPLMPLHVSDLMPLHRSGQVLVVADELISARLLLNRQHTDRATRHPDRFARHRLHLS